MLLPLALIAPIAHAQAAFTDLTTIDREVATFTGKSIGQAGGATLPVDRRLRLAACLAPLSVNWRSASRDTVVVSCPDPGSWRLFVPVRAVEGAAVSVARGEVVSIAVVGEGFTVSQSGEAMDSGAIGDWIRVRGLRDGTPKGEPIRARITRPGEVEVPLRE
ncbi:hypothetical protein GTZ99_13115 [Novosphingobium sp. FSY-8]|uniref:Flagella basal body P-ring formation protein FlgA n=1 Tax=Novosphingobium ovatum TaxID=1908523 RepID=A0ABW9XG87_9SPHN|nr:hypothetical protein [Novosphingobium ovatum]